jgi:hypothetical protein
MESNTIFESSEFKAHQRDAPAVAVVLLFGVFQPGC